ncbi:unnamed protein product [Rotaria socialis]|uniref:G domain-containing protein n=2 Tax=Rotaria socialis TaxID=392032 RepID=A0A818Y4S9_9BILA|nr:unnamed protein product [Rotaria socialis]CAF3255663.1 unnamed protein product [Rotaria socialis]CAF3306752.1 unnamed protein product [Rotaria socialis]CAF3325988.1 unnamed protein product [Rotaria socialis]CAF3749661.1 unnamed protein product [Rotaria socialis]
MKPLAIFRNQFDFQSLRWKDMIRWFPGHMHKGMKDLEESLLRTDGIIEVHDARVPHSGRNSELYKRLVGGHKPHLLILNKSDLADPHYVNKSMEYIQIEQPNTQVVHTSLMSIDMKELTNLFGRLLQQIVESPRYTRRSSIEYNIVVCGIPNVGKSTFINKLRNLFANKASCERVGASPGVTRSMSEKVKISNRPKVFVRDTPGILEPRLKSANESFRLLLTNCIPIQQRELSDIIADYGLFLLNKYEQQRLYMKYCELDRPTDDILTVLTAIAKLKKCTQVYGNKRGYDLTGAALHFINEFNKGTFGHITLDQDILDAMEQEKLSDTNLFRASSGRIKKSI